MHNSFIFSLVPLLLPCGFLSSKIIWSQYSILSSVRTTPQRKIKALARFPLLRTGLKIWSGRDQKADKFSSIVYSCSMTDGLAQFLVLWIYKEGKARRLLCFRKCVWLSTIITVSQAIPHKPGGPLDIETEVSSSEPFMARCGAGRVGKLSKTPRRLRFIKIHKDRRKCK